MKQASMWEGHIGSKAHRVAVVKLKEAEEERRIAEKRKAEEQDDEEGSASKKRRFSEESDEDESAMPMTSASKGNASGFPADFFSDPSRAVPLPGDDDDEGEQPTTLPPGTQEAALQTKSALDLEWEAFQAALLKNPDEDKDEEQRDAFNRATVFAEPELVVADDSANGFPPAVGTEPEAVEMEHKEETEEEKRKRKEQEERELIMDRLIEEERIQEEADARVSLLKAKLDAVKKARSERKGKKA